MASKIAGLYDMEATLGSGHFAVVKSARHVFTGLRVAIKVIDKTKLDEVSRTHLYQEVRCMKLVTHPSIIRLFEVIDTQNKLYLIQELGDGGDLYDFIMKHSNGIEESLARRIFRQTVSAIRYCHKLHVVHRDLKPENLVFCTGQASMPSEKGSPRVKLTDFGLSRTFLPGELIESSCGSLEYSAPEILLGDSYDPPKVDVWSLGVILFMLITGHSPFAYGGPGETLTRIMDGKYHVPPHVSEKCRNLIGKMLVVDPQRRSSLDNVANHSWLQENCDEEPVPLPTIGNIGEIPTDELELHLYRMEQGGYGTFDEILKCINEKPYGSTAATLFLLVEAERHRKYARSHHLPSTPTRNRKFSMPSPNIPVSLQTPSPRRSHGSAETGVLQPRPKAAPAGFRPPTADHDPTYLRRFSGDDGTPSPAVTPLRNSILSRTPLTPLMSPNTPVYQTSNSPHVGVGGEQLSLNTTPKPAFPLQFQAMEETTTPSQTSPAPAQPPIVMAENFDHSSRLLRTGRTLSVFEEESETESIPDTSSQRQLSASPHSSPLMPGSPIHRSRSRRLMEARSSPNIFKVMSKSDVSDDDEEEEDDDIVELMTTSGRFPNKNNTFPRLSPGSSPLLTSRRSPTHYLTGSSDDEVTAVFAEKTKKNRIKRLPFRKRSYSGKVARVDSISSDDGGSKDNTPSRKSRRERLLRLKKYSSLPATPAASEFNSESLTEILDNIRRQRSGSCRTDSSLSDGGRSGTGDRDMNELANSLVEKFEISDEEASAEHSMDTGSPVMTTDHNRRTNGSTTLRSVFCKIL